MTNLEQIILSLFDEIYTGARKGINMIDVVTDELGEYFNDVKNSKNAKLQYAYSLMRENGADAEDDTRYMAEIAQLAIVSLKGE